MKLDPQYVWRGVHRQLQFKIQWWYLDHPVWNYYVYLPEYLLKDRFQQLWLEPRVVKTAPESYGFVMYDYHEIPRIHVKAWHGGITYYAKHGEVVGYRCVELGCDYNHLWDAETGYSDTLKSVMFDCQQTIEQLCETLELMPKAEVKP